MKNRGWRIGLAAVLLAFCVSAVAAVTIDPAVWTKMYLSGIKATLGRRGFAATDPRTVSTLKSIATKVRGADAAAYGRMSKFMGRATPWINAAVLVNNGLMLYGVIGGGVDEKADPNSYSAPSPAPGATQPRWRSGIYYAATMEQALYADILDTTTATEVRGYKVTTTAPITGYNSTANCNEYQYTVVAFVPNTSTSDPDDYKNSNIRSIVCVNVPWECDGKMIKKSSTCVADYTEPKFRPLPATTTRYATLADWYAAQTDAWKDQEATAQLMAEAAAEGHAYAAKQPGFEGVPFSVTAAPKPSDFPSPRPRNRDLLDTDLSGWPLPVDDPDGTVTPPAGSTKIDLGPDPGTPDAPLEEPPTGIMDPVKNAMAGLFNADTSLAAEACPTWSRTVVYRSWSWGLNIYQHCDLIAPYTSFIYGLFVALWGVLALFKVLEA